MAEVRARLSARRVPTRLQYQTTECGVAALAMVLAYYGRHAPMEDIRHVTGVSRDCLNAADMVRAGRHYGMECAAYSREPEDLRRMAFPFIAHLSFIHFVVVEGMTSDHVLVNDPACGRSEIPIEIFDEIFTGIVIAMRPGPDFESSGRKDQLYADLWQRLDGRTKAILALAVVTACLSPLTLVFLAHILGGATDDISNGAEISASVVAALSFALVSRGALGLMQSLSLAHMQQRISTRLAGALLEALIKRPFAYLSYRLPSEQTKSVYANHVIARFLCRDILPFLLTLPSVGVILGAMTWFHPAAASLAAVMTALLAVSLAICSGWRSGEGRTYALRADEGFWGLLTQTSTIEECKINGIDSDFVASNMGQEAVVAVHNQRDAVARITGLAISHVAAYTIIFGTALIAGSAWRVDDLGLAQFIAVVFLACTLAFAIWSWPQLRGKLSALHHVLLRQDDLGRKGTDDQVLAAPRAASKGETLLFKDVTFGHSPTRLPLLNGVDFAFTAAAEQVGITGPSGGGKSTFASVAAGLHTPWSGALETGSHVMWVDKSPFIFDGTVRENLLLWRDNVDDADLWRALSDACIDDVIEARADGLDTRMIARGCNFSGGQRQRLEIARALTFDPSVLILDEALDALNPELEMQVRANLRKRGCALVIVSHRTSTLAACDRVLHFSGGRLMVRPPIAETVEAMPLRAQIETTFTAPSDTYTWKAPDLEGFTDTDGLYTRQVRFTQKDHWQRPHLPLVGYRRGYTTPVLLHPAAGGYRIDGEKNVVSIDTMEPTAQCIYPVADLQVRAPGALFRHWASQARTDIAWAAVISLCGIAAIIFLVFLASLPLVDAMPPPGWKLWTSLIAGLGVIGLLQAAQGLSLLRAEHRIRVSAMNDIFQRMISIRPQFFRTVSPKVLARAFAALYQMLELLKSTAMSKGADAVLIVGSCFVLGWLDIWLGLTAAMMSISIIVLWGWMARAAASIQRDIYDRRLAGHRFLFDMMQGIARLRVMSGEKRAASHWQTLFERAHGISLRQETITAWARNAGDLNLWLSLVALVAISAGVSDKATSVWTINLTLLAAFLTFTAAIRFGETLAGMQCTFGGMQGLKEFLDAPLEPQGICPDLCHDIKFENIGFRYDTALDWALDDVTFKISLGDTIAIVGPSGSGKSTLLRLLLGFDEVSSGRMHIGDQNLEDTDIQAWRTGIGVVQQDDRVPDATTIRSVISGMAIVDLEDVWRAADLAALGDDIRAIPMGMQTIVEHGKFSTGQEQRLLIARQLLRRPTMLILDEATNAIPEDMQARIFANLRTEGISCILATHRESAIAAADRVIVLAAGRLAWEGAPEAFAADRQFMDIVRRERLVEGEE